MLPLASQFPPVNAGDLQSSTFSLWEIQLYWYSDVVCSGRDVPIGDKEQLYHLLFTYNYMHNDIFYRFDNTGEKSPSQCVLPVCNFSVLMRAKNDYIQSNINLS